MTIGLFVDVSNLYYCINKKYENRKLNYERFLNYVKDLGTVHRAIAYGSQINAQAAKFITCLKALGYDAKYKEPRDLGNNEYRRIDWNVGIGMDVVRMIDKLDTVVIASASGELVELVNWIKERGVRVIILACGISRELKAAADRYIEIQKELLDEPVEAA